MNTAIKRTLLSTIVAPLVLGAASVSAQKITTWTYEVDNDLHSAVFTDKQNGNAGDTDDSDSQLISWGSDTDPTERSSVGINDVPAGSGPVTTDGAAVNAGVFTHNNQTIDADFDTLLSFSVTSTLTLDPATPLGEGSQEVLPPITFNTKFTETPNQTTPCADGGGTPCGDIFTVVSIDGLGDFTGGSLPGQEFTQGDYIYTVFLELTGLGVLPNSACSAAGAANGCFGLLTAENSDNTFQSSFRITAREVEVPEPGTLALLGLGLAGLGLSRRRKAAKA